MLMLMRFSVTFLYCVKPLSVYSDSDSYHLGPLGSTDLMDTIVRRSDARDSLL